MLCTQLVLLHVTCARAQGFFFNATSVGVGVFSKATCTRNMCCCTQHVHVFKAAFSREMCCCTQHLHARNTRTRPSVTCMHMLQHATCARVHVHQIFKCGTQHVHVRVCTCIGLATGLAMNQHAYATCVPLQATVARVHIAHVPKSTESCTCFT
jgi:hypothetical protein